jgi:hypothetical protein
MGRTRGEISMDWSGFEEWEIASILVVAAVAGTMTYFTADVDGVSLYVNAILGGLFALLAAAGSLLVFRHFGLVSEFVDDSRR